MKRVYLLVSESSLDRESLQKAFASVFASLSFPSDKEAVGEGEGDALYALEKGISVYHHETGSNLIVLAVHRFDGFSAKLAHEALSFLPNKASFMSDVILHELRYGDYSSLSFLSALFADLPQEIMETALEYLRHDRDALSASSSLYIHRNTFLYRMKAFKKMTMLDVRDYHDGLLLELYTGLLKRN